MSLRQHIVAATYADEGVTIERLLKEAKLSEMDHKRFSARGAALVQQIRDTSDPSIMELFLGEYGLSSEEGIALMCLAEALLRVPDVATIDELIEDKIVPSQWSAHLGQSHSPLINASTWALMLTGRVLDDHQTGIGATLRGAIKRLGEPVIRAAVAQAMREMGRQFVLGETIQKAMKRAESMEAKGFTYSYDMLGEAARTEADAKRFFLAYTETITQISKAAISNDIRQNPGISIKLSALHPRYEPLQRPRVMDELVPKVLALATHAKCARLGLNIDAEEAARLDLSLDVIDAVLSHPSLSGWDGFGVVVQAYSKRAGLVLDWLYSRAQDLDRRIMVRLVKGAYWDTEIKLAQVQGLQGFPVFTHKPATDVSYIACAKKLFAMNDRIYPQFATHNAHTIAAVLDMAPEQAAFEFQRLHGMGETLHNKVMEAENSRCRIYAPVGQHKDLLAYLVRRLLENGANSSFVNQIVDETIPAETVATDPIAALALAPKSTIQTPADLFIPKRKNSIGFDVSDPTALAQLLKDRDAKSTTIAGSQGSQAVINPGTGNVMGYVHFARADEAKAIADTLTPWSASVKHRAEVLNKAADLYEAHRAELFALLAQEAGKTLIDCIGELREAVDFLRFYAAEVISQAPKPLGIFLCISPWNFPLAIFTGQIAAALATGNGVIAKPAEDTSLIAKKATALLHEAGVPQSVLACVAGEGAIVGPALCCHPKTAGVAFTGSTATGQAINRELAAHKPMNTPLIAETGGINAMIVDSTALLEQAITDIVTSAFQSAGQRCSALRVLYIQSDIANDLETMLFGAMDALVIGDPADPSTDIGPLINAAAYTNITDYIDKAASEGRVVKQLTTPRQGYFVAPTVLRVNSITEITKEVFGPVLHIVRFEASNIDTVIDEINATGYGLTFGLHTRIDSRVQHIVERVDVGNIYVNRDQIGAVVESQPFGGHGLSGTGPKAGGARYLYAFQADQPIKNDRENVRLPGPTGEDNRYHTTPLDHILCAGPGEVQAKMQAELAKAAGCREITLAPDVTSQTILDMKVLNAVLFWGEMPRALRLACAARSGAIPKIIHDKHQLFHLKKEKTICIDITASGGNAALLAQVSAEQHR